MDIVGPRNTMLMSVVSPGSSYPFLHGDAWEPWMLGTQVQNEMCTLQHMVLTQRRAPEQPGCLAPHPVTVSLDGVLDYIEMYLEAGNVYSGCVHDVVSREGELNGWAYLGCRRYHLTGWDPGEEKKEAKENAGTLSVP